ncbi:hypothetical protein DFJ74DRAFT_700914 [Hyaloraphidium curvatum]|nr:hypothetical protein DFJ74DRAFT_700914 [Hyaloraphidium curvatum]
MLAARVHDDRKLHLDTVDVPSLPASGAVLVDVLYAPVLTYAGQVIVGDLPRYLLPPFPTTFGPGCVGKVRETSGDVFDLAAGQLVDVDPQIGSRQNGGTYDEVLVGLTRFGEKSGRVQEIWNEGTWRQQHVAPIRSVTALPHSEIDPALWATNAALALAYHGLVRANIRAGQVVIVNGSTGYFGSCAVLVALALGAGKVIATGRSPTSLATLSAKLTKFGRRCEVIPSSEGDKLAAAAGKDPSDANTGAHVVIDLVGNATSSEATVACMRLLRRGGAMVLEGSMSSPLQFHYGEIMINNWTIIGNYMYPATSIADLAPLVVSGQLDLSLIDVHKYPLEKAVEAVEHAARTGPLELVVVCPNGV